jgi:hypothetical protein
MPRTHLFSSQFQSFQWFDEAHHKRNLKRYAPFKTFSRRPFKDRRFKILKFARDRRRYLHWVFEAKKTLGSVDAQLYRGMVYLAGTKLNPSRFAPAERFESQQAKKIGP